MVKLDNRQKIEITLQIAFFEGNIDMLNRFIDYNQQKSKISEHSLTSETMNQENNIYSKEEMEKIVEANYKAIFDKLDEYKKQKAINFLIINKFKKFEKETRAKL